MSWRIGVALLALLPALSASASAADEAVRVTEAERAVLELEAGFLVAKEAMQARLEILRESEEYKKAREAEDYDRLRELGMAIQQPVMDEWQRKFADGAAPFDGSEGEIVFAVATLKQFLAEDPPALILSTLGEHPKSARLAPVLDLSPRYLGKSPRKAELREILGRVIAENPDATIRAHAYFARAEAVRYDPEATDEQKTEAEEDRAAVLGLVPETSLLSMRVRGPEFEKTRLGVGMAAPEIEGPDLFGKTIRLSDFRGKVVMLDFWGDW
jgi:hypothetical protein